MPFGSTPADSSLKKSMSEQLKIENSSKISYGPFLLVAYLEWVLSNKIRLDTSVSPQNPLY